MDEVVVFRGVSRDEEGRKKVERTYVRTNNLGRLKHIEKKLISNGVLRMERHPVNGTLSLNRKPKSGHGVKFSWEGPRGLVVNNELFNVPSAMDKGDPNYVDEDQWQPEENYVDEEEWEDFLLINFKENNQKNYEEEEWEKFLILRKLKRFMLMMKKNGKSPCLID